MNRIIFRADAEIPDVPDPDIVTGRLDGREAAAKLPAMTRLGCRRKLIEKLLLKNDHEH